MILRFHRMVGEGLGEAFSAEPGAFRRKNVAVGSYRPPSFEEVPDLVDNLCTLLDREFHFRAKQTFEEAMIEAIVKDDLSEFIAYAALGLRDRLKAILKKK
ncbi:MAG: Fic family protein [Spirochaetaceae bacterium]|nr:Fic family protein [Spirochaetaceae bacterium]